MKQYLIHLFIHSGYFYSVSSSPLLLRGTPNIAQILLEFSQPQIPSSVQLLVNKEFFHQSSFYLSNVLFINLEGNCPRPLKNDEDGGWHPTFGCWSSCWSSNAAEHDRIEEDLLTKQNNDGWNVSGMDEWNPRDKGPLQRKTSAAIEEITMTLIRKSLKTTKHRKQNVFIWKELWLLSSVPMNSE